MSRRFQFVLLAHTSTFVGIVSFVAVCLEIYSRISIKSLFSPCRCRLAVDDSCKAAAYGTWFEKPEAASLTLVATLGFC